MGKIFPGSKWRTFHINLRQKEFPPGGVPFGGNDLLLSVLIMLCRFQRQHTVWTASFSRFQQDLIWSSSRARYFWGNRGCDKATNYNMLPLCTLYMEHLKKTNPLHLVHIFSWKMYSRFVFLILGGVTKLLIIACSHSRIHTHNHSACIPALCHHHLRSILIVIFVSSRNIYNYSITNHPPVSSVIIIFS